MAKQASRKNWFQETVATVVGSVIVLVLQTHCGLTPPAATTVPAPVTAAANVRANALRYFEEATQCTRQGDFDRAIDHYTEAIRLNPSLAPAYAHRGRAYGQQGRYEQAFKDSSEALRLDPGSAFAYLLRGWAAGQIEQYEQAIRDCTEALRLDPSLTQAYQIRSWAWAHVPRPAPGPGSRPATAAR